MSRPRTGPTRPGARASSMPAPTVLDRYALGQRLGTGAFGTVWLARDEHLERDVAVKILARELVAGGRFEREARAAARLQHPGIVTLYEAAVDDDGAYLVSELVRGRTLDALLTAGELSDRDVLAIGAGLCDALAHAHEQGVVHRDVKPSNVLVPDGRGTGSNPSAAKLTDFGVARVIGPAGGRGSDSLTMTGDVIGTLNYMAPEQAAGLEAGEPADLYSLALVLYEALSGVNPQRAANADPRRRARRPAMQLPPLRRQRRDLPPPLGHAIDRALRPRPDERGTLEQLREALAGGAEHVDDEPGVVTAARLLPGRDRDGELPRGADGRPLFAPRDDAGAADEELPEPDASRLVWQARALGGAGAAASTAWLSHRLLAPGDTLSAPLTVTALVAGGLAVLLPRLSWLAIAVYLCAAAAIQGHAGAATLVAVGAAIPIVLLPASPTLWPVAAAAPALGLIGLAGAWPALAGWAHRPWRRMMLGAVGGAWLALAGPLAGRRLYLREPATVAARPRWQGSVTHAVEHVLHPLLSSGVLALAVVWAAAAVLAPWIRRPRSPVTAVAVAVVWAAALFVATPVALRAAGAGERLAHPPGAVAGAVAAALLALAPLAVGAGHRAVRRASFPDRVP